MTIYICGDSTAASYAAELAPIIGWGQVLPELLDGIPVENRAMPARSSKSYLAEGRLIAIEPLLRPGDLLLIQFAHNDESDLVWRRTEPWGAYQNNLSIFVDTARERGATPVLLTPICIRCFRDGALQPSHEGYRQAVADLARQRCVPLVDVYRRSFEHVRALGDEASKALYMHLRPGEWPHYPDGQADDTHTRRPGAEMYARFVVEGLKEHHLI